MRCDTCDQDPCTNPSFCRACRIADDRKCRGVQAQNAGPLSHSPSMAKGRDPRTLREALAEKDAFVERQTGGLHGAER